MNKKFAAEVLKQRSDLVVVENAFALRPIEAVICGFLSESAPHGTYAWRFALPTYDRIDFLHLAFGERLPCAAEKVESPKAKAEGFLKCVAPYIPATREWGTAENFLTIAADSQRLQNPWGRRGYALTLIILGKEDLARNEIGALLSMDGISRYPRFVEDVMEIKLALDIGVQEARALLLDWRKSTLAKFGLERDAGAVQF